MPLIKGRHGPPSTAAFLSHKTLWNQGTDEAVLKEVGTGMDRVGAC